MFVLVLFPAMNDLVLAVLVLAVVVQFDASAGNTVSNTLVENFKYENEVNFSLSETTF